MLLKFIAEVAEEPLILDPDHRAAESQTNTWLLSATEAERAALTAAQVAAAFGDTAEALRGRVRDLGFRGTVTFYVWHDRQVGALRCSTSSRPPQALPFGGDYTMTDDLEPIIAGFLDDGGPGTVPWSDLVDAGPGKPEQDEDDTAPPSFPVWTRRIGSDS